MTTTETNSTERWRDAEALVSLAALRRNLGALTALLPEGADFAALVKSDAYGHGAKEVARTVLDAGARFLAVATADEARGLREMGFDADVLILGPIFPHEAEEAVGSDFSVCVGSLEIARALSAVAGRLGRRARVHLTVDTGMGRFGFLDAPDSLGAALDAIGGLDNLEIEGLMTHFSEADDPASDYTAEQTGRFRRVMEALSDRGIRPRWVHAANSGGLVHFPETHFAMARIGIAMYGVRPHVNPLAADGEGARLEPVMSMTTHVADLREVPAGMPVSYGRRFTTRRPSRLALLPVGYGNGYPRSATGRAEAVVRGRRVPIVGTITMNLVVADATDVPEVAVGDPVLMFGCADGCELRVEEVAAAAGTIGYEVLCNVGRATPRRHVD